MAINSETHLIARARDDLAVIRGEGNAEDIVLVANEAAGSGTLVQVPKTESVVPRPRQRELAIRRNDDVRHKVAMAVQALLGHAIISLVMCHMPHNDGLVCNAEKSMVRYVKGIWK